MTSNKADESQAFSTVTEEGAEHISPDVFVTVGSSSDFAQLVLREGAVAAQPQLLAGRDGAWEPVQWPLGKWLREFAGCAERAALLHGEQGAGSGKSQVEEPGDARSQQLLG